MFGEPTLDRAAWKDTRVALPKADKIHECDWTAARFVELKRFIAKEVPGSAYKRAIMGMIERNLDPTKALVDEGDMAKVWADRERNGPTSEVYAKSLAEVACDAEGAPYVLHALIARLSTPFISFRDQSEAAFLDEAHCAGVHGLSEADKAVLKKIAAPAAPQAPKP